MFFNDPHLRRLTSYDILSLPESKLKPTKAPEYSSACPVCGGEDRFLFWPDSGSYWCRQCGLTGVILDATPEQVPSKRKLAPITYGHEEVADWQLYHKALLSNEYALRLWETALGPDYMKAVKYYGLGFCTNLWGFGATITIPVSYSGKKFLVKHRRLLPEKPRYLTEPEGVGTMLFNVDMVLREPRVIIVEGEKKAMRLSLAGYPTVSSSTGATSFESMWGVFLFGKEIIIMADPDIPGEKAAKQIQAKVGGTIITPPDKIDDWINSGRDAASLLGEPWFTFPEMREEKWVAGYHLQRSIKI